MIELNGRYENISQRVACSYIRSQAELTTAGMDETMAASARELHAFFQAFYQRVYDAPAEFGLPTTPDDCITGQEKNGTQKKAEMNRKLSKPREMIGTGIDFLLLAGQQGRLAADGQSLALAPDAVSAFVEKSRNKKQFLKGFGGAGLDIQEGPQAVVLRCPRYPRMFAALQALAQACANFPDPRLGRYHFGRCEFRALDPAYQPAAQNLFRVFNQADYERVARLDSYFTARGYKASFRVNGFFEWEFQYQGRRSAKGSPLLRIAYCERYQIPLRIDVKCASTNRLLPLLAQQPRALQEDFNRRTFNCGGDACGWCKTRPHLGPSTFEFDGVTRTVCWYSNGEFAGLNDETETLIHQYADLHEALG